MNFSQALTLAKTDRLRMARKLWSTPQWFRDHDRTAGRWLMYVMALDGRAFGVTSPAALCDPPLGPMVLVTIFYMGGAATASPRSYEPSLEDLLADDWDFIDDAEVKKVVKTIERPPA